MYVYFRFTLLFKLEYIMRSNTVKFARIYIFYLSLAIMLFIINFIMGMKVYQIYSIQIF